MEIDAYLRVIRRWVWLIVLMTIAAAGVCYLLVQRQPTVYVAQVRLLVGPGVEDASSDFNVLRASSQVMQTYAELATTQNVLKQVIEDLHLDITPSNLSGHITTTPNPNSGLLLIAVRSADQKEAVAIANDLAKVLVSLRSEKANSGSGNTKDLSAQVSQLQEESARIQARITELEADFKAASAAGSQPPITDQENKVRALEAQLAAPDDPALTKQMQDHQARIQQLEASLRSTVNVDARRLILDELVREDDTLQLLIARVNDRKRLLLDQLGQERSRLTSMQTSISGKQNLILTQLSIARTQLADTQRALTALVPALQNASSSQITIIDPAVSAPPEAGQSTLIVLIAALAGLVLALTLAFVFDYLDDKIRTPEQLEGTGARVWGWVGRQKVLPPPGPSKHGSTLSADGKMVEAFRRLSIELMSRTSSVLIANFEQGDSAAEIASNLAISLARAGRRVVLMDANIRQPTLGTWFQAENKEGLTDWLASGMRDLNLVPIEWVPGLSVLPAGTVHGNSARELGWPRMADLIERVESQTDMLIVAGPPLSTSADSLFLASHLGGVLAVAQSGRTPLALAGATIENLRMVGIQVLGLILADGTRPFIKIPRRLESRQTPPSGKRLPPSTSPPQPNPKDKVRGLGPVTEARSGETSSGKNAELGATKSNI